MRITLKKAYADGTTAVDMDPLSLLCRVATSVPPPRRHAIRYSGVLAPGSRMGDGPRGGGACPPSRIVEQVAAQSEPLLSAHARRMQVQVDLTREIVGLLLLMSLSRRLAQGQ